jgi:hypothetical protein
MPPRILITCDDIVTVAAMAKALVAIAAVLKDGAGSRRHMTSAALAILQCVTSAEALASTLNDRADEARERAHVKAEKNARDQKAGGLLDKSKPNKNMPQASAIFSPTKKPAFEEATYNTCLKCQHDNLNVQMTDLQYTQECSRAQLVYDDKLTLFNAPPFLARTGKGPRRTDPPRKIGCYCYTFNSFNQSSGGNCPNCQANSAAGLPVDSS